MFTELCQRSAHLHAYQELSSMLTCHAQELHIASDLVCSSANSNRHVSYEGVLAQHLLLETSGAPITHSFEGKASVKLQMESGPSDFTTLSVLLHFAEAQDTTMLAACCWAML